MTSPAERIVSGPISLGGRSHHPVLAVCAVLLGSYLVNFDGRLFSTGLPDLRGDLGLGFDDAAWLNTAAFAPQILIAPAVTWLAMVFGARRVLVPPSLIYAAVSALIPLTRDYETLIALHVVRGLLLGIFVPAWLMIVFRNLPMRWWFSAVAIYALRVPVTSNFGIVLVGFYDTTLGTHWLYWQGALVAPTVGLLAFFGTPHEPVNRDALIKADWGGMLLFGTGLAMIFAALDQGNRLDWLNSGVIVALLAGGTALLLAFIVNEALVADPWAPARVLLSRNIALNLAAAAIFTILAASNAALVPNFLEAIGQLRPEQIGPMLVTSVVLPLIVLQPIAAVLLRRVDARLVLIIGFSAFACASLLGTGLTHDWRADDFRLIGMLQSVGFAFTFLPIIIFMLANVDTKRVVPFTAYIQVIRLAGPEFAVALVATWVRVREQVHSNLIGLHVAAGSATVTHTLEMLSAPFRGDEAASAPARALATLAGLVRREAGVLAYIDGFWMMFSLAVLAVVLVGLMKEAPDGPFKHRAASIKTQRGIAEPQSR